VLRSGLDICFRVAAPGVTLVPAAGPEESPCAGPAAMAIGAQNKNIDSIPADKRALALSFAASLCLVLQRIPSGRGSYWISYLIGNFAVWQQHAPTRPF
jgi:hypothetical protein